uniref:40S ribosomal protein S6, putative n=1 Tax=Arundo donax TaxID=35708 RepID=A0A0A9ERQ8_ARUDO
MLNFMAAVRRELAGGEEL